MSNPPNRTFVSNILITLSVVTLVLGVSAARAHRVQQHRLTMISIYLGALVITGLFTLLPNRLIGHALWALFV